MPINNKISIPLQAEEIKEIADHISLLNKLRFNGKSYSTRSQWVREAILEKIKAGNEMIDRKKVNTNRKIENEIADINNNLKNK